MPYLIEIHTEDYPRPLDTNIAKQAPIVLIVILALLLSGCGSSSYPSTKGPNPSATLRATLMPSTTASDTPTSSPTEFHTQTPSPTSTPLPVTEVLGPMTFLEAWQLIAADYKTIGFSELPPVEDYCQTLITRANLPELDPNACNFVGVARGLDDVHIEGWVLTIPKDYDNLIWVAPNVTQHKDGPKLVDCYSDPPIGNLNEEYFVYETSSGSLRVIPAYYDSCTGEGIRP